MATLLHMGDLKRKIKLVIVFSKNRPPFNFCLRLESLDSHFKIQLKSLLSMLHLLIT